MGITAKKTGNDITYYTRDSNGTILNSHGAGGTVNYFSEFNGSVAALYSTTGTELGSYRYSPYGQTTAIGTAAESNPFRYIGGHQDKNNNGNDSHYKLGARYYDGHGHFTQPDPIVPGGGDYVYSGGDPVNRSDPSGKAFVDFSGQACALVCINGGIGTDGDFDPSLGVGVGTELGASASLTPGFGSNEGWSVGSSCTAARGAGVTATGSFSEGPSYSGGVGATVGLDGGCQFAKATYTW